MKKVKLLAKKKLIEHTGFTNENYIFEIVYLLIKSIIDKEQIIYYNGYTE